MNDAKQGVTGIGYERGQVMSTDTKSQWLAFGGYTIWYNSNKIPIDGNMTQVQTSSQLGRSSQKDLDSSTKQSMARTPTLTPSNWEMKTMESNQLDVHVREVLDALNHLEDDCQQNQTEQVYILQRISFQWHPLHRKVLQKLQLSFWANLKTFRIWSEIKSTTDSLRVNVEKSR